jgi:predicted O-methyltransferase YrrM
MVRGGPRDEAPERGAGVRVLPHFLLWAVGLERARSRTTGPMRSALARHARGRRRLVEIGCLYGVNTCNLRRAMHPEGVLFAVDPFRPGRLGVSLEKIIAHREVSRAPNGRVQWLEMTDLAAAGHFDATGEAPVDFVFSDAVNTREGFRATWDAWSHRVVPGGLYVVNSVVGTPRMAIHDAESAVYYREALRVDPRFEVLEEIDNMAVLRRRVIERG